MRKYVEVSEEDYAMLDAAQEVARAVATRPPGDPHIAQRLTEWEAKREAFMDGFKPPLEDACPDEEPAT